MPRSLLITENSPFALVVTAAASLTLLLRSCRTNFRTLAFAIGSPDFALRTKPSSLPMPQDCRRTIARLLTQTSQVEMELSVSEKSGLTLAIIK